MVMTQEMLECGRCNTRNYQAVGADQLASLDSPGAIQCYCEKCQGKTWWRSASQDQDPAKVFPIAPDPLLETFGSRSQGRDSGKAFSVAPDPLLETGYLGQDREAAKSAPIAPDPLLDTGYSARDPQKQPRVAPSWDWYG